MSMPAISVVIVISALAAVVVVALAVAALGARRGGRVQGSRALRLVHMGRLSARLSTSWLGARVRRLFASPERRRHLDAARRRQAAEAVAETMGHMKGAFMK